MDIAVAVSIALASKSACLPSSVELFGVGGIFLLCRRCVSGGGVVDGLLRLLPEVDVSMHCSPASISSYLVRPLNEIFLFPLFCLIIFNIW